MSIAHIRHMAHIGDMAAEMLVIDAAIVLACHHGLEEIAQKIEETAKAEIGTYVGNKWPELSELTQYARSKAGFPPNDPLLMTGELRDSISHVVGAMEAEIGSTSKIMVWQEMGTDRIPPRPVLLPAAEKNMPNMARILASLIAKGLIGGSITTVRRDFTRVDAS